MKIRISEFLKFLPKITKNFFNLHLINVINRFYFLKNIYYLIIRNQKLIKYSKKWYEKDYHIKKLELDKVSYDRLMSYWEKAGYKKRLFNVLDKIKLQKNPNWLEVACHHGKTAFWSAERYPDAFFYMFDFSKPAIEWIIKNNPIPQRSEVWVGDITNISYKGKTFTDFFDIITCIDVTEHLPHKIYKIGIKEIYRVLKPRGILIIMQGNSILPEHINVMTEKQYLTDFLKRGFKFVKYLPNRHYYLTK